MQNNETTSSSGVSPAPFEADVQTAVQKANETYVKEILADPQLIGTKTGNFEGWLKFQEGDDAARRLWEKAPANQQPTISAETTKRELAGMEGVADTTVRHNFGVLPIEEMTAAEKAILTDVAENWNEPAGESEVDTNAKISNEFTIEPGLSGSLKNAGMDSEMSFPVHYHEGKPSLQTRGGGGKSMEFNQMLALTAGLAAGAGLPMPAFNLPSRLRQERKHYDPQPETAESRNVRSAWNFAIEQERQAKEQYKKAVPREERILQKKKKK